VTPWRSPSTVDYAPDMARPVESMADVEVKPRLRGVSHAVAFVLTIPLGIVLVLQADTTLGRIAALAFGATVVTMFGASAVYHCFTWPDGTRRWLRRVDHAGIYALIAGTYTPFGLLVLDGTWRVVVLAIVWSGAAAAIVLKFVWVDAPKWLAVGIGIALGWIGAAIFPQILDEIGFGPSMLVLAGGLCYTGGALVYGLKRPNPWPRVFGYHEIFHALVILAVAFQYSAIAFWVLPEH
jgi:hemolysin III